MIHRSWEKFEGPMADLGAISEAAEWSAAAWGSEGDGRDLAAMAKKPRREEINFADPEAILIAAEDGHTEDAACALGADPMVTAWMTQPVAVTKVRLAA